MWSSLSIADVGVAEWKFPKLRCKDGPPPVQRIRKQVTSKPLVESVEDEPDSGFLEELLMEVPGRSSKIMRDAGKSAGKSERPTSIIYKEWALSDSKQKLPLEGALEPPPPFLLLEIEVPDAVKEHINEMKVELCSRDVVVRAIDTGDVMLHIPFSFAIDDSAASARFRRKRRLLCIEAPTLVSSAPKQHEHEQEMDSSDQQLFQIF